MLDQVSAISSQKLKQTLLNPTDLKLLLTKLEDQLMSHPHLTLPQWEGDNLWYVYKFLKLQSFMLSDTLYIVLHVPLVDKLLQFYLYRIHKIPLVNPVLKNHLYTAFRKSTLQLGKICSTFHSP